MIDINLVVNHIGKKTNCNIQVDGTLKDAAEKIFRGSIDFKTGSSDSKGAETENVLLLGDDVVNKTIPLILCAEEMWRDHMERPSVSLTRILYSTSRQGESIWRQPRT